MMSASLERLRASSDSLLCAGVDTTIAALGNVLARRVGRLELAGTPERWLNNSIRTWCRLSLTVTEA